jgi:hypothetical protein
MTFKNKHHSSKSEHLKAVELPDEKTPEPAKVLEDVTLPSVEPAIIAAEERKLAGEPVALVNGVEVPTVEQVKAAGYSDEAAKTIADEQKAKAEAAAPAAAKPKRPAYRVTAQRAGGFWAIKRKFEQGEPVILFVDELSREQIANLESKPALALLVEKIEA